MNNNLKIKLINIAEGKISKKDPSHDIHHTLRVLALAEEIAITEGADLDIVIPAAIFHDVIVYKKNSHKSKNESEESARFAGEILSNVKGYSKNKIESVKTCIKQCSFSKGIKPDLLESKILQDADRLEATGAISIMRTFSSGGQMNTQFYPPNDPFCRKESMPFRSCLDLFYKRLLVVEKGMHTKFGRRIAKRRTNFLKIFLKELRLELKESKVI